MMRNMIIFSNHAQIKLSQRRILKEFVEETVQNPDHVFPTYGDRKVAYKLFDTKYLKVVFRIVNQNTVIITQHWDKNFKPN